MRTLPTAVALILGSVLFLIALNGVLSGLWGFGQDPIIGWLTSGPAQASQSIDLGNRLIWFAIALLPVLHWSLEVHASTRERSILIRTSASESIAIYSRAIVQFVENSLGEIPSILDSQVRVRQIGNGIAIKIVVSLKPVENIPGVQSQIEQATRRKLVELLGAEKVKRISVIVKGFGEFARHLPQGRHEIQIPARIAEQGRHASDSEATLPEREEIVLAPGSAGDESLGDDEDRPAGEPEHGEGEAPAGEITLVPPGPPRESAKVVPAYDEAEDEEKPDPIDSP